MIDDKVRVSKIVMDRISLQEFIIIFKMVDKITSIGTDDDIYKSEYNLYKDPKQKKLLPDKFLTICIKRHPDWLK